MLDERPREIGVLRGLGDAETVVRRCRPVSGRLRHTQRARIDPGALALHEEIGRRMGVQHPNGVAGEGAVRLDPASGPRDLVDRPALGRLGQTLQHGDRLRRVERRLLHVGG